MKATLQLIVFLLISNYSSSQLSIFYPYDSILNEPVETVFYAFDDGFQVIEVDHLGAYWNKVHQIDLAYPRGLSAAVDLPQPVSNEYFVRDTSGTIIRVYSTDRTLEEVNELFADVPIEKQSLFKENYQFFAISNQNARVDKVSYYEGKTREGLQYGVINRKGELVVPMEHQKIWIKDNEIFLMKDNKWALKNINQKIQTDFVYDNFDVDLLRDSSQTRIVYLKQANQFCAFYIQNSEKVIETTCYQRMQTDKYWAEYECILVRKDGKSGLINFDGKTILPLEYIGIYLIHDENCTIKPCVKLVQGTSIEFLETNNL